MCIITDCAPPVHQVTASHRILYVGHDLALLKFLNATLTNCHVIRSPGAVSHTLIKSNLPYSLFLLDAELPAVSTAELAHLIRSLPHRKRTPLIIHKDSGDLPSLTEAVTHALKQHPPD